MVWHLKQPFTELLESLYPYNAFFYPYNTFFHPLILLSTLYNSTLHLMKSNSIWMENRIKG